MLPETFYAEMGARIKELRTARHITQEQLAELLSVSIKHISTVERGLSGLSLERLVSICDYLDTSLDYLILGRPALPDLSLIPDSIIETLQNGSEEDKKYLLEYLMLYSHLHKQD